MVVGSLAWYLGAAPSTPRLMSAARVGPVVYGLLLTFRGDGYG